jgi:hypothetical protein
MQAVPLCGILSGLLSSELDYQLRPNNGYAFAAGLDV